MNEEAIELLFNDLENEFNVGTLEEFTSYLGDDKKRKRFYNEI